MSKRIPFGMFWVNIDQSCQLMIDDALGEHIRLTKFNITIH